MTNNTPSAPGADSNPSRGVQGLPAAQADHLEWLGSLKAGDAVGVTNAMGKTMLAPVAEVSARYVTVGTERFHRAGTTAGRRVGDTPATSTRKRLTRPPAGMTATNPASPLATIERHAASHASLSGSDAYSAQEAPRLECAAKAINDLLEVVAAARKALLESGDATNRSLGRELGIAAAKVAGPDYTPAATIKAGA